MSLGKPPFTNLPGRGFFKDLCLNDLEAVGGGKSRKGSSRKLFNLGLLFRRPYEAKNLLLGNFMLTEPHCVSRSSDLFSLVRLNCGQRHSAAVGLDIATNTGRFDGGGLWCTEGAGDTGSRSLFNLVNRSYLLELFVNLKFVLGIDCESLIYHTEVDYSCSHCRPPVSRIVFQC